jgi:DNA-binding SARP family transcriptional activator
MAHLVLNLLGTFQAILDGRPVDGFDYDKVRALLAYLAVESDRPHRREKLIGLFWPGYPESSARRSLAQALYSLRNALGDREAQVPFLLVTPQAIQFNPASDFRLDVDTFLAAVQRGGLSGLEEAVVIYRGRFLAGLSLDDCPAYDEWVALKREALH